MANVGEVDIKIGVDLRNLDKDLDKSKKMLKDLKKEAEKPFDLTIGESFKKDIQKAEQSFEKLSDEITKPLKMKVEFDKREVTRKFQSLVNEVNDPIALAIGINVKDANKDLKDFRKKVSRPITLQVKADATKGLQEVEKLRDKVNTPVELKIKNNARDVLNDFKDGLRELRTPIESKLKLNITDALNKLRQFRQVAKNDVRVNLVVDTGRATSAISSLQSEVRSIGSTTPEVDINTDQAERKLDGLMEKIGGLAGVLSGGLVVGASFNQATNHQEATAKVVAGTQTGGGVMTDLTRASVGDEIARQYKLQLGEYDEIANRINMTNQIATPNGTESFAIAEYGAYLEKTEQGETADVIKAYNAIKKNFGEKENLSTKDILNMIDYSVKNGLNYSDDMFDTIWEYSGQYATKGWSSGEMLGSLKAGKDAGAFNTDKVGDVVKESTLLLNDLSPDALLYLDELEKMGNKDLKKNVLKANSEGDYKTSSKLVMNALGGVKEADKKDRMALQFYGTPAEDLGLGVTEKVMNAKAISKEEIAGSVEQRKGEFDNTPIIKLKQNWAELMDALRPLGDHLIKMANDVLPVVTGAITGLSNWFTTLSDSGKSAMVVIGGLASTLGGVGLAKSVAGAIGKRKNGGTGTSGAGGTVIAGGGGNSRSTRNASGANATTRTARNASKIPSWIKDTGKGIGKKIPLLGTLLGVGAIGTSLMSGDKEGAINSGGMLAGGLAGGKLGAMAGGAIGSVVPGVGTAIGAGIGGVVGGVAGAIGGEKLTASIQENWDSIKKWTSDMASSVGTTVSGMASSVGTWFSNMSSIGVAVTMQMKDGVVNWFTSTKDGAIAKFTEMKTGVSTWFGSMRDDVVTKATELKDNTITNFTTLKDTASMKIGEFKNNVATGFLTMKDDAVIKATEMKDGIALRFGIMKESVSAKVNEIAGAVRSGFQSAKDGLSARADEMILKSGTAFGSILGSARNIIPSMFGIGQDIVSGLWNGIKSLGSWLDEKTGGFFGKVTKKVKNVFDTHSPSRVFMEIGQNLSQGLAIGVEKDEPKAIKSASNMASSVIDAGSTGFATPDLSFTPITGDSGSGGGTNIFQFNIQTSGSKREKDEIMHEIKREFRKYGLI